MARSRHTILETTRLKLRPLEESDGEAIEEFMSVKGVTDYLLFFSYPLQKDSVKNWLRSVLDASAEFCAYWGITHRGEDKVVGIISLTLDNYHHKGEIGFWLAKDRWNRGLMTEATWRVIEYGFETLHLHRIEITHMVENKASRRVVEKLGFQPEGCWREGHYKDGRWRDVSLYGMLDVDYRRSQRRFRDPEKSPLSHGKP
jgi:RimJ/RimL family protein N-acetyltransferase